MRAKFVAISVLIIASSVAFARGKPHYVFLLPDGYTGWVQVISQDRAAPPPTVEKGNLLVDLSDDGIFRTRSFHTMFVGAHDEFFYKHVGVGGKITRVPVPTEYVCTDMSGLDACYVPSEDKGADGFTVSRASVGKAGPSNEGVSWFLFIGPPDLRARSTVRVIFEPGTKKWMDHPENDPTPGRLK